MQAVEVVRHLGRRPQRVPEQRQHDGDPEEDEHDPLTGRPPVHARMVFIGVVILQPALIKGGSTLSLQEYLNLSRADVEANMVTVGLITEGDGNAPPADRTIPVPLPPGASIKLTLENLASVVPGVHEVAAVGVPDDRWGERPVLVAVFDGAETTRQAILARIAAAIAAGELPKWAAPDHIFAVVQLPRTSVGKIDKKVIRQMLTKGEIA